MKKKIQYKSSKKLIFLMKNGKSVNIPMYNIFFHFANNTIRLTDSSTEYYQGGRGHRTVNYTGTQSLLNTLLIR